jgi:aspartyl-tRNA(Asn)/glutamyl-tRNA(Gln) amidotransferase subunit A
MPISKRPTIREIHSLYQTKEVKPSQITDIFLKRAKEFNLELNSFLYFTDEIAQKQSQELDEELEKSNFEAIFKIKPLFGIPFAVKDIILVEGVEFKSASQILRGYKAPYSSTVYQKMVKAGAVLIGVCNMDEFAMGSSGESSSFGATKNPIDLERVPGGSSSGSAVAVASGQVVFSLGTDTGGSIRQPASFCDVVGLKPTYGLVSRFGVMPMASSFDQVGAFSNSVVDSLLITKLLAGKDVNDQTSLDKNEVVDKLWISYQQAVDKSVSKTNQKYKIGIPKEFYGEGIQPAIRQKLEWLQTQLQKQGHIMIEVNLPLIKHAISVYYLTMTVEVAANLERFDGIRYAQQPVLENGEMFYNQRENYFGKEPKRRIMLGTYASSSGYYDAYYNQAQKVRELARREFEEVFKQVDLLLTPTSPEFPFKFGEKTKNPLSMYLSDVFTCGINPSRIPGLTIPLGLLDNDQGQKLPTGCQILGSEFSEDKIFELGIEIEEVVKNSKL